MPSLKVPESVVPERVPVMLPPDCWLVGSVTVRLKEPLAVTEPLTLAVWDWVLPFEVVVRVPLKVPSPASVVMFSVQLLGRPDCVCRR